MPKSSDHDRPSSYAWAALVLFCLVQGLTLLIYPTVLNPGGPILLAGFLAVAVSLLRLGRGCGPYYHWGVDLAAVLLLWMTLSASRGLDSYLVQRSLLTFVGAVAFLWLAPCGARRGSDWKLLAHGLLVFSTIVCLLAWPEALEQARQTGSLPPLTGTFVNPDTFSILPLLALTLGIGLFQSASPRMALWLSLQMGVCFLTIAATGCRASLLGFSVASAAFLIVLWRNRSSRHLKKAQALLALPLVLALLALPLSNFGFKVFGKYADTLSGQALARETTRLEIASLAWKAVAERPLTGTGPGCFGLGFQSVRLPDQDRLYINIAHNDPAEMAVELGFPGLLLWLGLLYACLKKPYSSMLSGRRPILAGGALAAVVAITTYSLFNFVIAERPALWMQMFVFGLALSVPSSKLVSPEPRAARFISSLVLFGLGLWAISFGYTSLRAESLKAQSGLLAQKLQTEDAMKLLDQAIELQPHQISLRLDRASLAKTWGAFYPGQQNYQIRRAHLEAAHTSSPRNLAVLLALAELHTELAQLQQAHSYLDQARNIAPYHAAVREARAALAIREADYPQAAEILLQGGQEPRREEQIARLVMAAEFQKPGSGKAALQKALPTSGRDRVSAVVGQAILLCSQQSAWHPAELLADFAVSLSPEDLCLLTRRATIVGSTRGATAEYQTLTRSLQEAPPQRDNCYADMVTRWAALGIQQGHGRQVSDRLQDDLAEDARIVGSRIALSDYLLQEGQPREAITLLRAGLELDGTSVPLLLKTAEQYERSGSRELALSYYAEAAKASPEDRALQSQVARLKKRR